ncbi:MAG TPA: thiolase family protein [Vicinamibacterales bacterium]|jgi:acetyl-CoA acyltransferase|nr:thiolase family protein [Vicinamibacterales bacterium]
MHDAVIVSAVRTAVGKAPKGALSTVRPDEMAATVIAEALRRAPGVEPREIDDVILGCAMPEAEQGLNVARIASLRAGVPVEASAVTINRFCSSGLQAIAFAAERIMCGWAGAIVAGGTESMSLVPMGGNKVSPNPALVDSYPDVYLTTGLVAENHVRDHGISREEQDGFALRSHQRAVAAIDAGRFKDEVVPLAYRVASPDALSAATTAPAAPRCSVRDVTFAQDEGPRRDTSMDALAKLRPAFHASGSVTAGNSSQTSDGASAVLVTSAEFAKAHGLQPLARFVTYATAGVEPERFGIGPVPAIRKALKLAGLTLEQMDLVELNEAFAAQVLACLREMPIDPERLNVNGGAIALGHPLGCTGAKLTTTMLYEMRRRNARYGLVTMCVGGGMGAAGILERM